MNLDANIVIEKYKQTYADVAHENVLLKTYVEVLEDKVKTLEEQNNIIEDDEEVPTE